MEPKKSESGLEREDSSGKMPELSECNAFIHMLGASQGPRLGWFNITRAGWKVHSVVNLCTSF